MKNIKDLWNRMLLTTQRKAITVLKETFELTSTTYVKQNWIWGEGIPESNQEQVVTLFQKLLFDQEKETTEILKK